MSIPLQKRLTNPETLTKGKIPISGSVILIVLKLLITNIIIFFYRIVATSRGEIIMPVYKVWDADRSEKKIVVASDIEELIRKGECNV